MAKKFKFNERLVVTFDIEGKEYKRPYNESMMNSIEKMKQLFSDVKLETEDDLHDVEKKCGQITDAILGDGAFKEIFELRGYDIFDEVDLVLYLIEELNDFNQDIEKKANAGIDKAKKEQLEKAMETAVKEGEHDGMGTVRRFAPYA